MSLKEDEEVKVVVESQDDAQSSGDVSAANPSVHDADAKEKEMVEAAKRAGEAAAEEEIKAAAQKQLEQLTAERDELQKKLDGVSDEIKAAQTEAKEAKDHLVRLQADWENYRRRTAQERLDERQRAAEKLVLSLLPVLDDLERALEHAKSAADADGKTDQFDQFVEGVKAVHDKMLSTLAKEDVEVINPQGEAFDPLVHQAVGRIENADVYDETVVSVYRRGYRMAGKVIREAMVQVSFGGAKRPSEDKEASADKDASADKGAPAADKETADDKDTAHKESDDKK